jgi:hypothetical protein
MCNHCERDPRDEIAEATEALQGVVRMLSETGDSCTAAVLRLIEERLSPAADKIGHYVPRGHPLA